MHILTVAQSSRKQGRPGDAALSCSCASLSASPRSPPRRATGPLHLHPIPSHPIPSQPMASINPPQASSPVQSQTCLFAGPTVPVAHSSLALAAPKTPWTSSSLPFNPLPLHLHLHCRSICRPPPGLSTLVFTSGPSLAHTTLYPYPPLPTALLHLIIFPLHPMPPTSIPDRYHKKRMPQC